MRWTVGALVAVVIGVIISLGVSQGWFSGDEDSPGAEAVTTTGPEADQSQADAAPPVAATGDHPVCGLHETLVAEIQAHLPSDGVEDAAAINSAQIEFYQAATGVLDPADQGPFADMLSWYQAVAAYYEPFDWQPGLDDLAENPPPTVSSDTVAAASETLEELCGVVPQPDTPTP